MIPHDPRLRGIARVNAFPVSTSAGDSEGKYFSPTSARGVEGTYQETTKGQQRVVPCWRGFGVILKVKFIFNICPPLAGVGGGPAGTARIENDTIRLHP